MFIPYYSNPTSEISKITTLLAAQLGRHGVKKGCKNNVSLEKYVKDKIESFMDDQMSNENFMRAGTVASDDLEVLSKKALEKYD